MKINGRKIQPLEEDKAIWSCQNSGQWRQGEEECKQEVTLNAAPAPDRAGLPLSSCFPFPIYLLGEEDGVGVSVCVSSLKN